MRRGSGWFGSSGRKNVSFFYNCSHAIPTPEYNPLILWLINFWRIYCYEIEITTILKKKKVFMLLKTLVASTLILGASFSWGSAVTLDFTDSGTGGVWAGANGLTTYNTTVSGVSATLTATPAGAKLTTNTGTSEVAGCNAASAGLTCGGDGIGINDDEVTGGTLEKLTLTLAPTSSSIQLNLNSISFLDVFKENGRTERVDFEVFATSGGGIFSAYAAYSAGVNGGYTSWVASSAILGVSSIVFSAPGTSANDFALASVNLSTVSIPSNVPLPAAAWLFGSALFGLVAVARRRAVV